MNRMINTGCVVGISIVLAACGKPPSHSVEYYKANVTERTEMLQKCDADPDLSTKTSNCTSAATAESLSGSFEQSKPRAW
ncbi:EexN family lipoprotein [Pseudomonas sp. AK106]|jgi:hypothetical protein